MATVTGYTADKMQQFADASVVTGQVVGTNLHLTTQGGTVIDAGPVQGPANSLSIGTVSTGAPGSSASATVTGASPNQSLNLTLPQGPQGVVAVWQASHAYAAGDWVISPRNEVVKSKTARTSNATFDNAEASNWAGRDQHLVFSNGGFAWSANTAWDAGVLSVDTSSAASSQLSSPQPTFAVPGSLSGTIKFLEPGDYDIRWQNSCSAEPGNGGYKIVTSGTWPGTPDAPNQILGLGQHINASTYWETQIDGIGIRVPQANLEVRFVGTQANGGTNTPRIRVIKRTSI